MRKINPIIIGIIGVNIALFLFFTQHFLSTIAQLMGILDHYIFLLQGETTPVLVEWFYTVDEIGLHFIAEFILFMSAILFFISLFFIYHGLSQYMTLEKKLGVNQK